MNSQKWHDLSGLQSTKEQLKEAINYLHHAAQFVAIAGKNLVPQEDDDSNANLGWEEDWNSLTSHWVTGDNPFRVNLNIGNFELQIQAENKQIISKLPLTGLKKDEIMEWLKSAVTEAGAYGSKLHYIDHYEIPSHPVDSGESFGEITLTTRNDWSALFSNANSIINYITRKVQPGASIRVWPHHFDLGSYYPFGDGNKAIGVGLAIPDSVENDFYFYIYGWYANHEIDYTHAPGFETGIWHTGEWKGATLTLSDLKALTPGRQRGNLISFFDSGTDFLRKSIGG